MAERNSRGGIKKTGKNSKSSSTANRNTSYTTADGRGVRIKNGVKTYSDKPVNVKGRSGQSISGRDYSINKGGTGYAISADQIGDVTLQSSPNHHDQTTWATYWE